MKKYILLLAIAVLSTVKGFAQDFEVNGIYYIHTNGNSISVVASPEKYTGAVNIPPHITFGDITYTVTNIYSGAFTDCTGLTSVSIPNTVITIGAVISFAQGAFRNCTGLTSITLPGSLTSLFFDEFAGCTGLKSLVIPNSVTSIGNSCFSDCSGLTSLTISNSLTEIPGSAFANCSGLTSITIPGSVTSIGGTHLFSPYGAFHGCTGLTSITIPNTVTSIKEGAFYGCTGLASVILQDGAEPLSIHSYAFNGCSIETLHIGRMVSESPFSSKPTLKTLTLSNYVVSIVNSAFSGCSSLTSVDIPNSVTSIGKQAFTGCAGLTSITIPNSVTSIGDGAFQNCSSLTSVTIPTSITTIGSSTFRGCSGLTSITIPASVTSIGAYAFYDCSGLTSVIIPNSVTSIGSYAFRSCSSLTSVNIPASVTAIGNYTFYECGSLTSVIIPASVTSIGTYAFSGCIGLTSVTIPNSVTSIGEFAFGGCSGLTSVTIPRSVTSLGSVAFSGCSGLTSVYYNAIDCTIPPVYGGKPFNNCPNLTSLTIGGEVITIPNGAFSDCTGLTSITIPNSVTSVGSAAFSGCSGITSVTIPNSVISIGSGAFSGCGSLTSVIIPGSITLMSESVFSSCKNLTSINIPNSVTSIGNSAFSGCTGLTSVVIPNSITTIGMYAFNYCSGLTSVYLPASLTAIGDVAFSNCTNLTAIHANMIDPITINANVFTGVNKTTCNLYVPAGSLSQYQTANVWKDFLIRVEGYFNVTFDTQGGSAITSITVPQNGKVTKPADPTRTNYTFGGWYKEAACTNAWDFAANAVTGDMALYAKWTTPPVITITTPPAVNTNVTAGSITGSLSIAVSVTQDATLSYQWYSNTTNSNTGGTVISGATSANFTIPTTLTAGTYYYFCEVSTTGGATSVRSNVATVNVAATPVITITTQPTATTNVTAGSITGNLSIAANITQSATLIYQWYSNTTNNNTGGTAISGATSASFTIPITLTAGTYYYFCEVRAMGGATSVRSSVATVNVAAISVITITIQPTATTNVTAGSITGNLSVVASVTQSATLSYQWYSNTTNSNTGGTAITNATTANFTIPTTLIAGTYYYFCEIRATGGATSVRSSVATVNVAALPVINITTQPVATSNVTVGSITGNLSVAASVTQSATLSYQWYSNTTNSNTGGTVITGATSVSFTIPTVLTAGTYYYFCEVRATGGAVSVRTNVATITVTTSAIPVITISTHPAATTNVTTSSITGNLSVAATVTQSATLSYQWYANTTNNNTGGTVITGATSASFTIPTALTAGTYYYFCEIRATGGATSVRSNVATVNVTTKLTYTVTFNSQGGSTVVSQNVTQGSKATQPADPVYAGYNFGGWYKEMACNNAWNFNADVVTGNTMLYAKWTAAGGDCSNPVASGTAGSLAWKLCPNGTLTVSGAGAIPGYSIGSAPWYPYRTSVTSLIIEDGITTVGTRAFYGCTNLTSVTIQDGMVELKFNTAAGVFTGCPIETLYMGRNVTYISGSAPFKDITTLKTIVVGEHVTSIGSYAFSGCTALTSVTIHGSLASIGNNAFENCIALTDDAVHGILNAITTIEGSVFSGCTGLTTLIIPNKIMYIKDNAFKGCTNLKALFIQDGTANLFCGDDGHAFAGCPIESVYMGRNIYQIATYSAFEGNTALKTLTLGSNVTYINSESFNGCTGLTSVSIPGSLASIGSAAFQNCRGLTNEIINTLLTKITSANQSTFRGCTGLTSLVIPASITLVGKATFYGCSGLTSVIIEDGTETLSFGTYTDAFSECPIETIYMGRNTSQDAASTSSFRNNPALRTVTFGTGATSIRTNAFNSCTGLNTVTISSSVTAIGNDAFAGCTSLVKVTNQSLTPQIIAASVFNNVPVGTCVLNVPAASLSLYRAAAVWKDFLVQSVSSQTYTLAFNAQGGTVNPASKTVTAGEAIGVLPVPARIGFTFGGWYTQTGGGTQYTAITMYSVGGNTTLYAKWTADTYTVTFDSQGGSTVNSQTATQDSKVVQPANPVRTGYTFSGWYRDVNCTNAWSFNTDVVTGNMTLFAKWTVVASDCSNPIASGTTVGLKWALCPDGTLTFTGTGEIPGYSSFGEAPWFLHRELITGIVIGDGITSIGVRAFAWCQKFTSVTIPNSVTSIGVRAFEGCWGLTSIVIPNSVTSIGTSAFEGCRGLSSLTIPNSITSIEHATFRDCRELTSVTIPNSVTYMGNAVFEDCTKLTDIILSNSLKTIGEYAFYKCPLTTMVLPSTLEYIIGTHAFANTKLTVIYANMAEPPAIFASVFEGVNKNVCALYVPAGSLSKYQAASVWKDFLIRVEGYYTVTFLTNGGSAVVNDAVPTTSKLTKPADPLRTGYTFGGWYKESACVNAWNFASDVVTGDVILYAKWTKNTTSYTVMFSGTSVSIPQQTITEGGKVSRPTDPMRSGYTFGGWFKEAACTNLWNFTTNAVTGNATLYAKWNASNSHTITFSGVNVNIPPQTVAEGAKANRPTDPVREGYTFRGWYTDAGFIYPWDFGWEVDFNYTLYGKWVAGSTKELLLTVNVNGSNFEAAFNAELKKVGATKDQVTGLKITGQTFMASDFIFLLYGMKLKTLDMSGVKIEGNKIPDNAMLNMSLTHLTSISIPNTITHIGEFAFGAQTSLKTINKPNSLVSIGTSAFYGCMYLPITIPESVTTIGSFAFAGNYTTTITIPASVKTIKTCCFSDCPKITSIYVYHSTPLVLSDNIMESDPNSSVHIFGIPGTNNGQISRTNCILYVPKGSVSKYRSATTWKEFVNIKEMASGGAITGYVSGANANTVVHLYEQSPGISESVAKNALLGYVPVATVNTDAYGFYRFENIPKGNYRVVVEIYGYDSYPSGNISMSGDDDLQFVNFVVDDDNLVITPETFDAGNEPDKPTGIEIIDAINVAVYPNPFAAIVHVMGAEGCMLHVFSTSGVLVHVQQIVDPDQTIQLNGLPEGMYFFRLTKDGKIKTIKAIKSR